MPTPIFANHPRRCRCADCVYRAAERSRRAATIALVLFVLAVLLIFSAGCRNTENQHINDRELMTASRSDQSWP